jgi:Bifunctional DNA primase/polymerase, N-terminal
VANSPELNAALGLASQGLAVFPCRSDPDPDIDKTPATRNGFYAATTDPDRIRRWWWRDRLVGVPTGAVSGVVVLDIDPRHNGELWEEANARRLPITRVHRTQGGGRHYLFAYAGALRNSSGAIADGVDVRADGGYVIWWPACGIQPVHGIRLDCLAAWPKWLDRLIPKPVPSVPLPIPVDAQGASRLRSWSTEALKIAIRKVAKAPVGTRNHTLNAMTYMLGEYIHAGGLDVAEVVECMTIAARAAGEDERKITPTIQSALSARGVL